MIRNRTTDVLIVGGGPAGAATALSLLNFSENEVLLIEQSNLEQTRVGENVSSSILDIMDYLKIDRETFKKEMVIPAYSSISYWGSEYPSQINSIFTAENDTFQLDRQKFDFSLIKKVAEKGGTVFPRTKCVRYQQLENDTWEVTLKHTIKGTFKVHAKYLVDATGRKAGVSKKIGLQSTKIDNLMGVGTFLKLENIENIPNEQLLETTEFGWWYRALLPNNIVAITFFTDADIISKMNLNKSEEWNRLLQQTNHITSNIKGAISLLSQPWVRDASSQYIDATSIPNFIAVGDAAASFDPISSMGIGFAMTSACHAAKRIKYQLSGQLLERSSHNFQQDILTNFNNYLALRRQFYSKETRWPSSLFWERRKRLAILNNLAVMAK